MKISDQAVAEALVSSRGVHAKWPLDDIATIWTAGARAFGRERDAAGLLKTLVRWQALRSPRADPEVEDRFYSIWRWLTDLETPLRTRRLSDLCAADAPALDEIVKRVGDLKRNDDGPSLVAATKFLHAWNPRLFVMVDAYVMRDFVFRHAWVREDVGLARRSIDQPIVQLADYATVLVWAGQVLRDNPAIMSIYGRLIASSVTRGSAPPDCLEYEAVAFEWLLQGLVELPPAGVTLDHATT
jgi:hypothetical protein